MTLTIKQIINVGWIVCLLCLFGALAAQAGTVPVVDSCMSYSRTVDKCIIDGKAFYFDVPQFSASQRLALEERRAASASYIRAQVERAHELQIEQLKIETLARLQQLSAAQIDNRASAYIHLTNQMKINQKVKQSA